MSNIYADLCLKIQALRRDFEGLRTPLAPATGIAASIYTHQLATACRVLTDVRVRHLLADEVGLGKTVQALMILNALRYQRRDIRALVIVPDRLVPQWRDEIFTRAHSVPTGDEEGGEGSQYIRLAWEGQLRESQPAWTLAHIDPKIYQVLVVDELHELNSTTLERILRVASRFEHLLLLTATPAFQDSKKHAQLFAMLEPERTLLAEDTIGQEPGIGIVKSFLERDRITASDCAPEELTHVALANCAYRRVVRTRRGDYWGVLPSRKHVPILTEPLGAEEERQALMWEYFGHLAGITLDVDPILLAKRVILSPPSLEQRVDFLRRNGHDRLDLLGRAKPLVHKRNGDSRADILVDLLAGIWLENPKERVLVAAQDNLTVDYLYEIVNARLPLIGPLDYPQRLVAARIRQGMMTEAVEDLGGYGNETNENLEEFQRGEAQVLFAPEAAQVGLNLQCARILVLYSVPWRPQEVEQWIGRLDRIGNAAAFAQDGEARTIEIYTIAQRGLVDEKVVTVLRSFQAFERSINLDGEHLEEVARTIETAALKPQETNWRRLENMTEAMAAEDEVRELDSALRAHLPWTVEWASALRKRLDALAPAPLSLQRSKHIETGPRSWDRGLEGMLKLLGKAREYSFKWNDDPDGKRFLSLWYRFGERGVDGKKSIHSGLVFSIGADPSSERSPKHAHAFITRRGDIDAPPRRNVTLMLDDGDHARRPLHFMNFGNILHDEIVEHWLPKAEKLFVLEVHLPEHQTALDNNNSGPYVVRLAILDPASWLQAATFVESVLREILAAATRTSHERRNDLLLPFSNTVRCAIEADVRWLRTHLTAELIVRGLKTDGRRWVPASGNELSALLDPLTASGNGLPFSRPWVPSEQWGGALNKALDQLRSADPSAAGTCWSPWLPDLDRAVQLRLFVIREEARDANELANIELAKAEAAFGLACDRENQGQVTRARNLRDAAVDKASMTRVLWEQREAWLASCRSAVQGVRPEERLTAVLWVNRIQ